MSHLISVTSCSYIVAAEHHITQSQRHDALSQQIAAFRLFPEHQGIKMIPLPSIDVFFPRLASPTLSFVPDPKLQLLPLVISRPRWSTVMILSSSEPTEFPKPIHLSWTAVQEWLCAPREASVPMTGKTMSSMAWPSELFVPGAALIVKSINGVTDQSSMPKESWAAWYLQSLQVWLLRYFIRLSGARWSPKSRPRRSTMPVFQLASRFSICPH
jgi:hypothetical protein